MNANGKKFKNEWAFFINPKTARITYNKLCNKCECDCKQSYRVEVICCLDYRKKERSGNAELGGK